MESIVFKGKPGIIIFSLSACLVCMHQTSDKQAVSSSVACHKDASRYTLSAEKSWLPGSYA